MPTKRKKAARKAPAQKRASSKPSAERGGVGNEKRPKTKGVPEYIRTPARPESEEGTEVTDTPSVKGDQTQQIIDIRTGRPANVTLIEGGRGLTPDKSGTLVHVHSGVLNEVIPEEQAKALFARKPDGTIIFNQQGFDEVPGQVKFDMIDIVKLVDHNHKK